MTNVSRPVNRKKFAHAVKGCRIAALALLVSCSASEKEAAPPESFVFPPDFVFGVSISGFSHDPGCPTIPAAKCEDTHSDWYAYMTSPEMKAEHSAFITPEPLSNGPGHWELYETDIDLAAKGLGNNGFRTSFEWSRLFTVPTDKATSFDELQTLVDKDAVATYHKMFAAMIARGIKPLVTVNHYTLPIWIHDPVACHFNVDRCSPRGLLDPDRTLRELAKFTMYVAREFGGQIDWWATINEPMAVLVPGFLLQTKMRTNPPAVSLEIEHARTVLRTLIEMHARIYDALKKYDSADADGDGKATFVGVVHALAPIHPKDPNDRLDQKAAENISYIWNLAFLNATVNGIFDGDLDGQGEYRADLAGRMDYIGINYYSVGHVKGLEKSFLPDLSPLLTVNPLEIDMFNGIEPKGLYESVMIAHKTYGLPIIVTENGALFHVKAQDSALVQTLAWLSRAIREGADVRGYFYFSITDHFEWNYGTGAATGMYAVDPHDRSKKRVKRPAADLYRQISERHEIPAAMIADYPISAN